MVEHYDVVVVGAGLSGVGAAARLRRDRPGDRVVVLEARATMGGTWDLFRYPGVRSDSDMYTLGYSFEPWTEAEAIADGPAILRYIRRTARAYGVDALVRYRHRVVGADWSTAENRWTVDVERHGDGGATERLRLTCRWLHLCTGYYRYDAGYTPPIEGLDTFEGPVVHAQHWPDDLDWVGARVVVVGSGATAVTLVPTLAQRAAHVTMLQRSPSYVVPLPSRDRVADAARRVLPARTAHGVVRWKNALSGLASYRLSRRHPTVMRRLIRRQQRAFLSDDQIDSHFTPSYGPWDQRVCVAPDGDLFRCIRAGSVDVVTDTIERVTPSGVRVTSGRLIGADLLVLATGLRLQAFGGVAVSVDGAAQEPGDAVVYKGMMVAEVPNLTFTVGYTNASWTLKADLVAAYLVRLLDRLDRTGCTAAVPLTPPADVARVPIIDLRAGYVLRSLDDLPTQGDRAPWRLFQSYPRDVASLRLGRLEDEGIRFVPAR